VVPAALTAKPGTHFIQTEQPHSGAGYNGLSNTLTFVVNPAANPQPTITSLSPTSTAACGTSCANTSLTLTINGTNFLSGAAASGNNCLNASGTAVPCVSTVNWNMGATQTTFSTANNNPNNMTISSSSIQFTIPSSQATSLLANPGTAVVTVTNPPVTQTCQTGISCNGGGGGGTSPCPLMSGSTTVTVCTLTITDPANNGANASIQEETPAVSADGRYVAYADSENGHSQILARDTCQGADASCQPSTIVVSSAVDGTPGNDDSHAPAMNSSGRYVAFSSAAANLVEGAPAQNGRQVYLRDTCFGVTGSCAPSTQLVSTDANGALVGTEAILPSVSASGRYIAFLAVTASHGSSSPAAAAGKSGSAIPNSGLRQVFVRDTCLGVQNCTPSTTRISLQPGDGSGTTTKPAGPAISGGAKSIALAGGNTATVFTHSVPIDDNVFLALTKSAQ
jgi:WD40-like Beta Propeller Repeat